MKTKKILKPPKMPEFRYVRESNIYATPIIFFMVLILFVFLYFL